jgi:hypothetical protein
MQRSNRTSPSDDIAFDDEFRPQTCPNCGTERAGAYCHGCGQRFLKGRLTARELGWLFAERFLDWEEGVWRTFLKMASAPGVVVRDYLGGRRKTYLNPFSYLLFCVALYAVGQFAMRRIAGLSGLPGLEDVQRWGVAANNVEDQFSLVAYGTVAAVTVLALTMRLMFDGRLLNTVEAVVTTIYTAGNVFLLTLGVSVVEFVGSGDPLSLEGLVGAFALLFPLCMVHTGHGLFESWGMAGYSGLTPVIASFLGVGFTMVAYGVLYVVGGMISGLWTGSLSAIGAVGMFVAILVLLAPAVTPFLVDAFG